MKTENDKKPESCSRVSEKMLNTGEDEVYNWREVSTAPPPEQLLEREFGEGRRGRDVLIAVDHGANSKHAFDWALAHFCRIADTVHLVYAVSCVENEVVNEATRDLMCNLASEAFQVAKVKAIASIVEGDAGKVICREAERLKPAAVIMGTRSKGLAQSVLQGSVSEYCLHHCRVAPIVVVPAKESGEQSTI